LLEGLATEIRSFYSLRDLRESIEEEIAQYEAVADEYSQWLGSFLRDMEETYGGEEWFKRLTALQKSLKGRAKRESEKEGKGKKTKKASTSTEWVSYKGLMLSASEQGEAELLFDAIEEINRKIEQLNKVKSTIEALEKSTLGKDIIYIAYIRNGVPEKMVLRHKRDREFTDKFQFIADFSVLKEVYP
jgi:macrodomain Ter protein organizer (MatP/YcbG family)